MILRRRPVVRLLPRHVRYIHPLVATIQRMRPSPPPSPPNPHPQDVLILGSGNFGSCLADHLAHSAHNVSLWCRSPGVAESLNKVHRNPKYLTDHTFDEKIKAFSGDLGDLEIKEK